MNINVRGRDISVSDILAKEYARDWGKLPDERDVIIYLDACYHDGRAYEYLNTLPDSELTALVEKCMKEEL